MAKLTKLPDKFIGQFIPEPNSGCWIWLGSVGARGYGRYGRQSGSAHRLSYTVAKGPIPDGLVIDHLCRNRLCVNPDRLEAVTPKENTLRGCNFTAIHAAKTHCINGHKFTPDNTLVRIRNGTQRRQCRACQRDHVRKYRAKEALSDAEKVK